jgi:chemotaxis signal transduction protein
MVSRLMPVELINNWTPDGVDGGQVELVVAGAATPVEPAATPVEPVVALANGPESPAAGAPVAASPEEPPLVPVQSQATPSASEVPPVAAPIQAHYLLCQKTNASGLSSRFAIPVRYITEVVKAAELSPLPGAHPKVVGLMNLRGEPIPICKMPDFPRDSLSLRDNQLVALIRVKSELFGIVVDGADEIQVLDPETFQKPEALGTSTVEETWLRHLTKLDGQTVMIFDLEAA